MNRSGLKYWLIAGVVLVIALYLGSAFRLNRRFREEGTEVMGVVTRVYTRTEYRTERVTRRTSRQVPFTVHYLDYRFSAGDSVFEDSQRLGPTFVDVRKGDSVLVCYLPDEPEKSRLARDSSGNIRIRKVRARPRRR